MNRTASPGLHSPLIRLYLVFALLVIPAFAFYEGMLYLQENGNEVAKSRALQQLTKIRSDLHLHIDGEKFWVNSLTNIFATSDSTETLKLALDNFLNRLHSQAEYMVFSADGTLIHDNFIKPEAKDQWKSTGRDLLDVIGFDRSPARDQAIDRLRPRLGRNFFLPALGLKNQRIAAHLYHTDFKTEKSRVWLAINDKGLIIVMVPTIEISASRSLRYYLSQLDKREAGFAIFAHGQLVAANFDSMQARVAYGQLKRDPGKEFIVLAGSIFSPVQTGANRAILLRYQLQGHFLPVGRLAVMVLLVSGFLFTLLWRHGKGLVQLSDSSLLLQIATLLGISAGIPLTILGFVAYDYFSNKQSTLVREKNQQMVEFIQRVDQGLLSEYSKYTREIRKIFADEQSVQSSGFSPSRVGSKLAERLNHTFSSMHMVKMPPNAADLQNQEYYSVNGAGSLQDAPPDERRNVELLASHHLAALNSQTIAEVSAERAYLVEMVFQKPVNMVIYDLINAEGWLAEAGWGSMRFLLYAEAFSMSMREYFDLYLMGAFDMIVIQEEFMKAQINDLRRNPFGFKVFVARDRFLIDERKADLKENPELNELFLRVADYQLPEPEILTFQGQNCLFVGLKGHKTNRLSYCLLYPLENIEKEIHLEAGNLLFLALLAATLVVAMMLVLYLNLLLPVNRLHQAAVALEARDDSFRLPLGGNDEFSEMAAIFNSSMAEFEELKIASIVQARLLPGRPLEIEGYGIFGRSLPMIELGGDYFDYFAVGDNHFALLLGDVAGHGIGASLIMAMAKAGVICGRDVHNDPASLLARLHQIILAIKNRVQRKVMTFQFLLVERSSGLITYANAGGCSPVMFDAVSGTVTEIKHSGAVLGGFKKNVFNNLKLNILPGQAMILYTDGLVEAKNQAGVELGYQGFYDLIGACYDDSAEVFYHRIIAAWKAWLGGAEAGDDLTMIVMVRHKPET